MTSIVVTFLLDELLLLNKGKSTEGLQENLFNFLSRNRDEIPQKSTTSAAVILFLEK